MKYSVDNVIKWTNNIKDFPFSELYALEMIVKELILKHKKIELSEKEDPEYDEKFIDERLEEYSYILQSIEMAKMKKLGKTFG